MTTETDWRKTYEVTLSHDQWLTIILALWDSMTTTENDEELRQETRDYLIKEKMDIRKAIKAVLPI